MEKIVVEKTDVRLDVYLSDKLDYSRSNISKRIKDGKILVNEKFRGIMKSWCVKYLTTKCVKRESEANYE